MVRQSITDITVVLDRSGSMSAICKPTIKAFNRFVKSQCRGPDEAFLSLVQFDDQYEPMYSRLPILRAPKLTSQTYVPRGSTALFDAIGRTIESTHQRLVHSGVDSYANVVMVIQTDGFENASRYYSRERINAMISRFRDQHRWEFVFLGANQDAIMSAACVGIPRGAAITYGATCNGTHAVFDILGQKMTARRRASAKNEQPAPFHFTDDDRAQSMQ